MNSTGKTRKYLYIYSKLTPESSFMAKGTAKSKQLKKEPPITMAEEPVVPYGNVTDDFKNKPLLKGIHKAANAEVIAGSGTVLGIEDGIIVTIPGHKRKLAEHIPFAGLAGVLSEQHFTCLITSVTDKKITAETLVDKESNFIQTRSFDKLPLTGVVECKVGEVFNLAIVTKPGSREFIYTPGNSDDVKYFEETLADTTSLRNDLKNDPVFSQGPVLNDDGDSF